VGDVDYVAFAPPGESVEDLDRDAVFEALRGKVPYASLADAGDLRAAASDEEPAGGDEETDDRSESIARVGDGGAVPSAPSESGPTGPAGGSTDSPDVESESESDESTDDASESATETGDPPPAGDAGEPPNSEPTPTDEGETRASVDPDADGDGDLGADSVSDADAEPVDGVDDTDEDIDTDTHDEPGSMAAHVREVVDGETGRARLLGDEFDVLDEVDAADAFDAVDGAETVPHAVVVDGTVDQRLLDVAAQRGVGDLVGRDLGEFVKRPVGTRVLAADDVWAGS
jgi:hypothetical protein